MAWIELHQSLWTHKKTVMMAALLEIDELYAAAHMSKLWTWALDNAQDGDLSGLPNKVIAFGAGWKGDADEFINACIQTGWIDREEETTSLHDWYDYAGRLIDKKNANKERMRKARAHNVQRTNDEHATHVQGLPNLTLPNHNNNNKEAQIQILNLYCCLHNKLDMHVSAIERSKMMELANDMPLEFILENMPKIYESKREQIRGFGYYPLVLRDAWKNLTSTSISRKSENYSAPRQKSKQQIAIDREIAMNKWVEQGGDPLEFVFESIG